MTDGYDGNRSGYERFVKFEGDFYEIEFVGAFLGLVEKRTAEWIEKLEKSWEDGSFSQVRNILGDATVSPS
ncbi:hypothetical protein BPAE_0151g00300 [Botrytis paeoniae]|uniref:Uncharacterized protein n=1 Tax=Botrytis paeoniae TaxID=278948 RepID=A0A4Z1FJE3_9HELO|nr:hypothetical protein BPAE_0151g00300 [Botrytis paeoniae]